MKKIILGSIALLFFSLAVAIFQMSCKKSANGEIQLPGSSNTTQLNKIIFNKWPGNVPEIWICNYDGTSATKVNISLPSGYIFLDGGNPRMSPDGKKIFFIAAISNSSGGELYSCNADGSAVTKIVDKTGGGISMGGAY